MPARRSGGGRGVQTAAIAILVIGVSMALPAGANAGSVIYPTRTDDPVSPAGTACSVLPQNDTDCSLRNALATAGDGQEVSLGSPAPVGPYTVTRGKLTISHNVTLSGLGARTSTIAIPVGFGGAVLSVDSTATDATVEGVTITGGNDAFVGGGIQNLGGLTLRDTTVEGNHTTGTASEAHGGGIYSGGTLTLIRSTVSGNMAGPKDSASSQGGGLYQYAGTTSIINSTISGNSAPIGSGAGSSAGGGGIWLQGGATVYLANATLASNSTGGSGGNLELVSGTVSARNTIIASGTANTAGTENCMGTMSSQGYNLEDRNQCGLNNTGDQTNTSPLLGPLQDNGGPTDTLLPAPTSPVVDHGNPLGCFDPSAQLLTVDQRGFMRPVGPACDVGAVELQNRTLTVSVGGSGSGTVTGPGINCGSDCTETYLEGTDVALTANAANGSSFGGWSGDCSGTGACQVTMGADRAVSATFKPIPPSGTSPPNTVLTRARISSKKHKATFRFKASGRSTGFQCELARKHKRARFRACSSPKTYRHLKPARYTFKVRAKGPGGPDPTPAKKRFRIH